MKKLDLGNLKTTFENLEIIEENLIPELKGVLYDCIEKFYLDNEPSSDVTRYFQMKKNSFRKQNVRYQEDSNIIEDGSSSERMLR